MHRTVPSGSDMFGTGIDTDSDLDLASKVSYEFTVSWLAEDCCGEKSLHWELLGNDWMFDCDVYVHLAALAVLACWMPSSEWVRRWENSFLRQREWWRRRQQQARCFWQSRSSLQQFDWKIDTCISDSYFYFLKKNHRTGYVTYCMLLLFFQTLFVI